MCDMVGKQRADVFVCCCFTLKNKRPHVSEFDVQGDIGLLLFFYFFYFILFFFFGFV